MSVEKEEMQDWFFTFGKSHPLNLRYVRIFGTYNSARDKMIEIFGAKWGFQYNSEESAGVQKYGLRELPMNTDNNGGFVFPFKRPVLTKDKRLVEGFSDGITLRQYYAIQILKGILARDVLMPDPDNLLPIKMSVMIADNLIKELGNEHRS